MMAHYSGREPLPEKRPELDPDSATPEQVVEYYRDEPLFRDLTELIDRTIGTDHDLNPEAELVRTTEAFVHRLTDVRLYLEDIEAGRETRPDDPARQPAEDFVEFLQKSHGGRISKASFVNAELLRRYQLMKRARADALARFEEFKPIHP